MQQNFSYNKLLFIRFFKIIYIEFAFDKFDIDIH